jgi:UDP-MurNAc hydroxylase
LKNTKFTYVLYAEEKPKYIYQVDVTTGMVEELSPADVDLLDYEKYPAQIHTTAFIFRRCIGFRIFSHMSIGKRVFYKVTKDAKPKMETLNLVFNLEEYDMVPISRNFRARSIQTWWLRWRELVLYMSLVKDKILTGKIDFEKHLQPIDE